VINATLYGQISFLLIVFTTIVLLVKKHQAKTIIVNFILNFFQPFGLIYFLFILTKKKGASE